MGFGVSEAGKINKTVSNTVETAEKRDEDGVIVEMTTYGGVETTTTEEYTDQGSFTNAATNGQTITNLAGGVTENTLVEANDDYSRETTVTVKPLA